MGNSSGKMKVLHEEAAVVPPPVTENGTPADIENPDKIETVTSTAGEAAEVTANNEEQQENKTPENVSDAETSAVKKKGKPLSWLKKLSFKKDRKSKGSVETPNETAEKKEEKTTEGETAVASESTVEAKSEEGNGITTAEVKVETQATEPVVVVVSENKVDETPSVVDATPSSTQCQSTPVDVADKPVTADVVTDSAEATTEEKEEEQTPQISEVSKVEETNTTDTPTAITSEPEVTSTTVPSEEVITNGHQEEESKGDDSKEESHPITNGINGCHDEENEKQQTTAGDDVTSNESSKDVAALSRDLQSLEVNH